MRRAAAIVALACLAACTAEPAAPRAVPTPRTVVDRPAPTPPLREEHADPFAFSDPLEDLPGATEAETFDATVLRRRALSSYGAPRGIAAPPRSCDAWITRRPAPGRPACASVEETRAALDWALEPRVGTGERDGRLAALESCTALPPAQVRALRAEEAPVDCGDVLAASALRDASALDAPIAHLLVGTVIAARTSRASPTKAGEAALADLDAAAHALPASYGRGVALVGVSLAWSALRTDDARGRAEQAGIDAIRTLGDLGIGDAPRVAGALGVVSWRHAWLAELESLRIPRLGDGPRAPAPRRPIGRGGVPVCPHCYDDRRRAASPVERLAEELPSFHSTRILRDDELGTLEALRPLARRESLPSRARAALAARQLPREAARHLAAVRLRLGLRYLDRRGIDAAGVVLSRIEPTSRDDVERLLLALAIALHGMPPRGDAWLAGAPADDALPRGALDAVAGTAPDEVALLALHASQVLKELRGGAEARSRQELETQLATLDAALQRAHPSFLEERRNALQSLLRQAQGEDAFAPRADRLLGWPSVRPTSGTWIVPDRSFFVAIRGGNVARALRVLAYRWEPCFVAEANAKLPSDASVDVRFVLARSGAIAVATATSSPLRDAALEDCVVRTIRAIELPQPDMGPWIVDARFGRGARP